MSNLKNNIYVSSSLLRVCQIPLHPHNFDCSEKKISFIWFWFVHLNLFDYYRKQPCSQATESVALPRTLHVKSDSEHNNSVWGSILGLRLWHTNSALVKITVLKRCCLKLHEWYSKFTNWLSFVVLSLENLKTFVYITIIFNVMCKARNRLDKLFISSRLISKKNTNFKFGKIEGDKSSTNDRLSSRGG